MSDVKMTPGSSEQDLPEMEQESPTTTVVFGDHELSDVVLVTGETEFRVHKMLLAARSDVFNAMFYGKFVENGRNRIEIKDADPMAFSRLMEFLYNGRIQNAKDFLSSCYVGRKDFMEGSKKFWTESSALIGLADRFNISSIRPYFEDLISTNFVWKNGFHKEKTSHQCWECLDGRLFAMAHDLNVEQAHFKFNLAELHGWADNYADHVPPNLYISLKKMKEFFKQIVP